MSALTALVTQVRELVDNRNSHRKRIGTKKAERAAIADAPAARVEVMHYVAGWTKALGNEFEGTFRARMGAVFRKPDAVDPKNGRIGSVLTVLGLTRNPESEPSLVGADAALCWLLKDQLTAALTRIVDEMNIPYGLPREERRAKLVKLDAEIEALLAEEREMLEAAAEAGVVMEQP